MQESRGVLDRVATGKMVWAIEEVEKVVVWMLQELVSESGYLMMERPMRRKIEEVMVVVLDVESVLVWMNEKD